MGLPRSGPKVRNRKAHGRQTKSERKQQELTEIDALKKRLLNGIQFTEPPSKFTELPISSRTQRGLEDAHFIDMTDIQKCSLPIALTGLDIMGAAKTGSGKTLAFLVPVLEKLYLENWSIHDGLGALILSPTRELALQTFEVLRKIGKYHNISAGLIIGGKDIRLEQEAISRMNILVATPGRLLQHMDQTSLFEWSNLKILILDEADRILDLGFEKTMNSILSSLPKDRQTLLFSATQTDSVSSLARLSLESPVEISVHAKEEHVTPEKLAQKYIICPLDEKMDRLYSFIKSNLKSKTIVFFSSCKEVRFVYEAFCKLQPGVPLLHLHGRQKQFKRIAIFQDFCRKTNAVLFSTDVAARGLDFPSVDWVIQADCPEDVETYIHRVGRTARFDQSGNALLFLLPSERAILGDFKLKKIPITSMYTEGKSLPPPKRPVKSQLQSLCSQDPELKYLGQKALISYVRSVFLNGNKKVFNVHELPIDSFAESLGLSGTPKLRFVEKSAAKNESRQLRAALENSDDGEGGEEPLGSGNSRTLKKIDRMFKRKNLDVLSDHYAKLREKEDESHDSNDAKDEFLTIKRRDHEINPEELVQPKLPLAQSRRDLLRTKKKATLKNAPSSTHIRFDENDESHPVLPFTPEREFDQEKSPSLKENFLKEEMKLMELADKEDMERSRRIRRAAKLEKKRKLREASRPNQGSKIPKLQDRDDEREEEMSGSD